MTPGCEAEAEAEAICFFAKQFIDAEHNKVGQEIPAVGRKGRLELRMTWTREMGCFFRSLSPQWKAGHTGPTPILRTVPSRF